MKDYAKLWRAGNDAGDGFAVGEEDGSINQVDGIGDLVINGLDNDGFAVYVDRDGHETVVADANGPWAVRVDEILDC
jgi:hypothetical protein